MLAGIQGLRKYWHNRDSSVLSRSREHSRNRAFRSALSGRHLNMNRTRSLSCLPPPFELCLLYRSCHGNQIWFPKGESKLCQAKTFIPNSPTLPLFLSRQCCLPGFKRTAFGTRSFSRFGEKVRKGSIDPWLLRISHLLFPDIEMPVACISSDIYCEIKW